MFKVFDILSKEFTLNIYWVAFRTVFLTFYGTNWHSQGKGGGGLALTSNHLDIRSSSILWVPWINFINIFCQRFMNCVSLNPKNLRHNELQRNLLLSDCPSNWHFIKNGDMEARNNEFDKKWNSGSILARAWILLTAGVISKGF